MSKEVLSLLALLRAVGGSGIASNIGSVFGKLGSLFTGNASAEGAAATAGAAGHIAPLGSITVGKVFTTAETVALAEMAAESAYNMGKELVEHGTLLGIGQKDEYGSIDIGGIKIGGNRGETTSLWDAIATSLGIKPANASGSTTYRDGMTGMTQAELDAAAETFKEVGIVTNEVATGADEAADAISDMNAEYEKFAEQWRSIGMPEEEIQQLYESIQEQGALVVEGVGQTGANAASSLAAGILAGLPSVSAAVSRINSVVATLGGGSGGVPGGGMRTTANSYTRNNSIYINNLNQSNAADIYDTLRSMNGAQEVMNRGYGYVPVLG